MIKMSHVDDAVLNVAFSTEIESAAILFWFHRQILDRRMTRWQSNEIE